MIRQTVKSSHKLKEPLAKQSGPSNHDMYLISQCLDFLQRGSLSLHQGLLLRTRIRRLQQYNAQDGVVVVGSKRTPQNNMSYMQAGEKNKTKIDPSVRFASVCDECAARRRCQMRCLQAGECVSGVEGHPWDATWAGANRCALCRHAWTCRAELLGPFLFLPLRLKRCERCLSAGVITEPTLMRKKKIKNEPRPRWGREMSRWEGRERIAGVFNPHTAGQDS